MQGRMVGVIGSESDVCVWMITSKTRNALQRVTRNHGGNEQQWLVVCAISRAGDLAILWLLLISHGRGLLLLRESSIRQTSPKAKTLWLVERWRPLPEHDEGTGIGSWSVGTRRRGHHNTIRGRLQRTFLKYRKQVRKKTIDNQILRYNNLQYFYLHRVEPV